ncbi:MAG: phosphotransferase family protein [Burkholderiaceae bacterium]|nr:phosphotransferase family protein [Burkholderiaceae bacterium]
MRVRGLAGGTLQMRPLTGGQSNPTYLLDTGEARMVLRKQPPGVLLKSAHAVDREYRVIRALRGTAVPVPEGIAWCDDVQVVGTPFYLMSYVEGRVLVDQSLPGLSAAEREAIYRDMNRVIAALHEVDVDAVGLFDYGRREGFISRQVDRWSRQLEQSPLAPADEMRRQSVADPAWRFYLGFNLFRMSAILHGIAERALQGNANSTDAVQTGQKAAPLAALACCIVGI